MRKLAGADLSRLLDERPALKAELEGRGVVDVYRLNDMDTGPESERAGRRVALLLARRPGQDYIVMSTKGNPDKVATWLHTGDLSSQDPGGRYIVIDKSKVGRPRRELTEAERQQVTARRAAGETINQIAAALHIGTKRVMEVLNK